MPIFVANTIVIRNICLSQSKEVFSRPCIIIIQENETCPATKPEKKYINRNEREFPA
jgi:hypothetical protein